MISTFRLIFSLFSINLMCMFPAGVFASEGTVLTGTDDVAKLPFWEWRDGVKSIRLVQRLPDQTRAFFMARGFSKKHAELIAQSCIFQTVYKNISAKESSQVISFDLNSWEVLYKGNRQSLKVREEWDQQWQKLNITPSAKIAFSWSLIPTRQQYQPQDYNWGMTSYDLPPGERFDLKMYWKQNGQEKSAIIPEIQCAPDLHLDPGEAF